MNRSRTIIGVIVVGILAATCSAVSRWHKLVVQNAMHQHRGMIHCVTPSLSRHYAAYGRHCQSEYEVLGAIGACSECTTPIQVLFLENVDPWGNELQWQWRSRPDVDVLYLRLSGPDGAAHVTTDGRWCDVNTCHDCDDHEEAVAFVSK